VPSYRALAVVLRTYNLGEADKILVLFSRAEGKFSAVAKGARKPSSRSVGAAQVFCHYDYLLHRGKSLDIVSQYETLHSFKHIREDLDRLAYASYVAELILETSHERDPNAEVFDLLLWALDNIDSDRNPETALHVFELRLMDYLGYRPELDNCAVCGEEVRSNCYFSAEAGGIVCGRCAATGVLMTPLSEGAISTLRTLQSAQGQLWRSLRLQGSVGSEVCRALEEYVMYRIEKRLPSLQFLKTLKADK